MKVLSLLPVLGQPRDSKRISMLCELGYVVKVIAFERDYHSGRLPDVPIFILGKIGHGDYFIRFFKIIQVLPKVRSMLKGHDFIYTSGPDMALLALIAGFGLKPKVILEVGDIRNIQLRTDFIGKFVRFLDSRLVNLCKLLVVISPGFKHIYYEQWLQAKIPVLLIENKLEQNKILAKETLSVGKFSSYRLQTRKKKVIRIGYFGLLRDEWSLTALEYLASRYLDSLEIIFAGYPIDPISNLHDRIKKFPNMTYLGEYKSPDDLEDLYGSVDIIWACYPPMNANDWNLKWGRPNRFFESCYFKKPLLVRAGCHCAMEVEQYGIGKLIHGITMEEIFSEFASISYEDISEWTRHMHDLPESVYLYIDEAKNLQYEMERLHS
jgi:succinoglycan biosynthesis protein ExoL